MAPDVREMLARVLDELGADGLAAPGCGCAKDDLSPGDCLTNNCVAARRVVFDALTDEQQQDVADGPCECGPGDEVFIPLDEVK
jgi:hypothetical protein